MDKTFAQWLAEFDEVAGDYYGLGKASEITGPESWRDYYEDGDTPTYAFNHDIQYGAVA